MKVVFFYRKRLKGNFSIENLFKQICDAFPDEVRWEKLELSFYSRGFLKRLLIGLEAMVNQKGINHVTGDINFISIFLRKKKTVLTIHDVGYMQHNNPVARFLLLWFWIKLPVKRSAVVTTVSEATKKELMKYVIVNPQKIKVVNVPVSPVFLHVPKVFNKSEPTILQVGTKENKNLLRLIGAIKGICCRLEIVGTIPHPIEIELRNNGINYSNSVDLSNEEIFIKYCSSDIVSFVSTYEGFGIPIIEGNAVGRVVVTSNILSMPEVAGNAAHLVDPFNVESIRKGILKVIDDDEYREKLIANGFINMKRFKVEAIAKEYQNIYESMALQS
jgi:glycosyltransferase involved in cell wall biosynthesis